MKHELSASQARMLRALEKWMEDFLCNDSERTDGMIYALDNGWTIHAVDYMAGTGATDKRFDRIYSALVRSVGSNKWFELNRAEAKSLCDFATITVCSNCNAHHFTDPHEDAPETCSSCLADLSSESKGA